MRTIGYLFCLLVLFKYVAMETITATIYADNYFEFYVNGVLVKADPLDFTPHNAVKFTFEASGTRTYGIVAKDFTTPSGYEYTEAPASTQLGDGALRVILSDGTVTSTQWKCFTTNFGPTDASKTAGCSATNLAPCNCSITSAPTGWNLTGFDDSSWSNATSYTEAQAGWGSPPSYNGGMCGILTSPYTKTQLSPSSIATLADECLKPQEQVWGSSVFIWQGDLERDNNILCRYTYYDGSATTGSATTGVATTGAATTSAATSGAATTGSATTGSATTGSATTGSATTGSATSSAATSSAATSSAATTGSATTGSATSGAASETSSSNTLSVVYVMLYMILFVCQLW